jgi:hypothetical protein
MKSYSEVMELQDHSRDTVDIPEWETTLNIRSVTGTQRAEIEDFWSRKPPPREIRIVILSRTVVGEDWNTPWASAEQWSALMDEKNAKPIERAMAKALDVCAFGEEDVEELGNE